MKNEQLNALIRSHPVYIPVSEAAAFLHMGADALRASMEQNRCPFGFSWKLGERNGYKIPTIAFVAWLTKGAFGKATDPIFWTHGLGQNTSGPYPELHQPGGHEICAGDN